MSVRTTVILGLLALACGPPAPETPAEACGRAAGIYMGLQLPVEVVSQESDGAGVSVRIEGMDRANIPAKGEATCVFSDPAAPAKGLERAEIEGGPLGRHEIAALNRSLAGE